jgi:hypothetical protein
MSDAPEEMTMMHGGSEPDPTHPPSAASLARAAHDLARSADLLAHVLVTATLPPDAAHRAERAILDAREGVARAYLNAGVRP